MLYRADTRRDSIAQRCEQHPSIDPALVGQQSPSSPCARQAAFALHAAVVCHGGPGVGETPDEGETETGDGAGGKVCVTPAWQPQQSGTVSHEFAGTWLHQLLQVHATLRVQPWQDGISAHEADGLCRHHPAQLVCMTEVHAQQSVIDDCDCAGTF